MKIEEMIEVLEASKRGEAIEMRTVGSQVWGAFSPPVWDFWHNDFRIAPKKATLVEELRANKHLNTQLTSRAADQIELLQNKYDGYSIADHTTDELLAEIARRIGK
jgi:hypothetical protein